MKTQASRLCYEAMLQDGGPEAVLAHFDNLKKPQGTLIAEDESGCLVALITRKEQEDENAFK